MMTHVRFGVTLNPRDLPRCRRIVAAAVVVVVDVHVARRKDPVATVIDDENERRIVAVSTAMLLRVHAVHTRRAADLKAGSV